jgi:Lar family restriction alleviation protein
MDKLLPCPFCGGEACENEHKFFGYASTFGVVCLDCCAETRQFYNTSEEAIAAWNTRVKE